MGFVIRPFKFVGVKRGGMLFLFKLLPVCVHAYVHVGWFAADLQIAQSPFLVSYSHDFILFD